jgi:CO dehydrogenase maturation factor
MKIAVLGKGGSGKSSVSWLFTQYLLSEKKQILAIDADYNMDLSANLGLDPHTITQTIHNTEEEFKHQIGMVANSYKEFSTQSFTPTKKFTLQDPFTQSLIQKNSQDINLIVGGIGGEDVLLSNKCGHAHLSPLKYYLGLLETNENEYVIIDSVAGLDMVNFGLYCGCDLVVCVVENHRNSIHVYQQISAVCKKFEIPLAVILNKISPSFIHTKEFCEFANQFPLIGYIEMNEDLMNLQFTDDMKKNLKAIFQKIDAFGKPSPYWQIIRDFDSMKLGMITR